MQAFEHLLNIIASHSCTAYHGAAFKTTIISC